MRRERLVESGNNMIGMLLPICTYSGVSSSERASRVSIARSQGVSTSVSQYDRGLNTE